jgi:hypothetical protein
MGEVQFIHLRCIGFESFFEGVAHWPALSFLLTWSFFIRSAVVPFSSSFATPTRNQQTKPVGREMGGEGGGAQNGGPRCYVFGMSKKAYTMDDFCL